MTARAKVNLALIVGPGRPDGFHELATVFQSISLADTLEIRPAARGFSLELVHEPAAEPTTVTAPSNRRRPAAAARVPAGDDNLVLRAARLISAKHGWSAGARFRLVKRIPAGAGLGGGSADAAAALTGLARMHGVRCSRAELMALGAELGSDVPFALLGGTALGLGRGERLFPIRLARPFKALLVVPSWRISTQHAFSTIDQHKKLLTPWPAKLRSAQILGRKRLRAESWMRLGNDFEAVLGRRNEDVRSIRDRLREAGASHARMTGSGSAVFGILEPAISFKEAVRRFEGSESVFGIRSREAGLGFEPLHEA